MIQLLLAILSSSAIAILMRMADKKIQNTMIMFIGNYAVCAMLSYAFSGGILLHGNGGRPAVLLGVVSGFLYLASFILYQFTIRNNGVVLAATFMKLGVLVPTILAILCFHENPQVLQVFGIGLALTAIPVLNGKNEDGKGMLVWLILLLLVSGITDSMVNIFDKTVSTDWKDLYLLCTFGTAGLLCVGIAFLQKQKPTHADLLWGALIGIPNYFSSRFLLGALRSIPAVIVYPVFNVGSILIVSLVGLILFKERFSTRKWAGLAMIVCSLVLLNI